MAGLVIIRLDLIQENIFYLNFSMILQGCGNKLVNCDDDIDSDYEETIKAGEATCDAAYRITAPGKV